MRHGPKRALLTPWKRRCRCGCAWYPCPDAATVQPPPVVLSLSGSYGLDLTSPGELHRSTAGVRLIGRAPTKGRSDDRPEQ
jgi:hypothetical protein